MLRPPFTINDFPPPETDNFKKSVDSFGVNIEEFKREIEQKLRDLHKFEFNNENNPILKYGKEEEKDSTNHETGRINMGGTMPENNNIGETARRITVGNGTLPGTSNQTNTTKIASAWPPKASTHPVQSPQNLKYTREVRVIKKRDITLKGNALKHPQALPTLTVLNINIAGAVDEVVVWTLTNTSQEVTPGTPLYQMLEQAYQDAIK